MSLYYNKIRPEEEAWPALTVVERVVPGRSSDVRGPNDAELQATDVLAMEIVEASAKIRSGPPVDAPDDHKLPVWAGEVPLRLVADPAKPAGRCTSDVPNYLEDYGRVRR